MGLTSTAVCKVVLRLDGVELSVSVVGGGGGLGGRV